MMPASALPVVWDHCSFHNGASLEQSTDPQGNRCSNPEDGLFRFKLADGTCSDWMCCPKNTSSDAPAGSYDCSRGTSPTRAIRPGIKAILGGLSATAIVPATGAGATRTLSPVTAAPTRR